MSGISPKKEKEDTQSLQTKASQEKKIEDKGVRIEKIIEELPELLVKHAYQKLKSGQELTASEMKVCLEVCKTYSSEKLGAKPDNILEKVPFDTNG
jgi:glutamate/tyrosine decarboxylase-like PLP-dependent enzyme